MARMFNSHKRRYAHLGDWLSGELPTVNKKSKVWGALIDHWPGNNVTEAQRAVNFGTDPIVFVEDLPGAFGKFSPGQPDMVSIGKELVRRYELEPGNAEEKIEATVLHELVHWAWNKAGLKERKEMGKEFERAAYVSDSAEFIVHEVGRELETDSEQLGLLSRAYESRGNPAALGQDSTGGWSYGLYQLASKKGSVASFLNFLGESSNEHPNYVNFGKQLQDAGGSLGARLGRQSFQDTWRTLAGQPEFSQAQHDFIQETHYKPFIRNLQSNGIDIKTRSAALKDVAWSVSVQHGSGRTEIFIRALRALPASSRSNDADLINAIYDERSRVEVYFRSSSAEVKTAVSERFKKERLAALAALAAA